MFVISLQKYSIITRKPNKIEGNFTPFLHRFYTKIHQIFAKNAHFIEEKGKKTTFLCIMCILLCQTDGVHQVSFER